ncbi:cupin domain-containing protein [Membranicola marinus]|uniref:Cupin domain-containing protein n=1 Tax=Membranihabitans marinus TaxID=1227546 RepID=A0A953L5N7_9BACT|nr:cupin domain-containing protein [Membranihabitans marinus]MBY5956787.1 cupin domain-containing protein [Membranihabitans marinus]
MKKVTNPNVKLLAKGDKFTAKQMAAKAGALLPKHRASVESVLVMLEGECVLSLAQTKHVLKPGDSFIIPPKIIHQISASQDFRAVHVMTKDIKFDFFE